MFYIKKYFCIMGIENIEKPVEIIYAKVDECPVKNRQFNFFQIVYVISGTGSYVLNGETKPYKSENLLLLVPDDVHTFNVDISTEFLLIRFNYIYLNDYKWKYIDHLKSSLSNAGRLNEDIIKLESDKHLVRSIVKSILYGIQNSDIFYRELTSHLVNSFLIIITRNLVNYQSEIIAESKDKRLIEIINYIQKNIYCPELLRASSISMSFNISANYLSRFFKDKSGELLQDYITNYKILLIKNRLKFSDMRVNEIADEFGFSDGSHLNKFFKNRNGISISDYRKNTAVLV